MSFNNLIVFYKNYTFTFNKNCGNYYHLPTSIYGEFSFTAKFYGSWKNPSMSMLL